MESDGGLAFTSKTPLQKTLLQLEPTQAHNGDTFIRTFPVGKFIKFPCGNYSDSSHVLSLVNIMYSKH